jgi:hypothetical protein
VVEYVQVHGNLDDGVEWFGGTVNAKYLVLTSNYDDDIDYDEGFVGNIQHALIIKDPTGTDPQGNDPRGIEGNSSDEDSVSGTSAVLANITIIGSDITSGDNKQPAMRLRGDVTTEIHNFAISNYNTVCMRFDNGDDSLTNITVNNVLSGACGDEFDENDSPTVSKTNNVNLAATGLTFNAFGAVTNTDITVSSNTPTAVGSSSFAFDTTDYVGAVDPDATEAWWDGWTIPGSVVFP